MGRLSTVLKGLLMLLLTVMFLISVNIVLGRPSVERLFSMMARMVRVFRLGARSSTYRSL